MKKMKHWSKVLALVLVCALVLPCVPAGVFAEEITITAGDIDAVWNDASTFISCMAGQPYYMVKGEVHYYHENQTYVPHYDDGAKDMHLRAEALATMLDVEVADIVSAMSAKEWPIVGHATVDSEKLFSLKQTAWAAGKEVITNVKRGGNGADNDDAGIFVIVDADDITDENQKISCANLATTAYGDQISLKIATVEEAVELAAGASLPAAPRTNLDGQKQLMKISFWAKGTGAPQFKVYPCDANQVQNASGFIPNKFNPTISDTEYRYFEFEVYPSQFGTQSGRVAIPVGPTSGSISIYGLSIRKYNTFRVGAADIPGTLSDVSALKVGDTVSFELNDVSNAARYESIIMRLKSGNTVLCESVTPVSSLTNESKTCSMKITTGGSDLSLQIVAKNLDRNEFTVANIVPTCKYGLVQYGNGTAYDQSELTVAGIGWYDIKGENDKQNAVVSNLVLPATTPAGEAITWSSNHAAIAADGTVTRPARGEADANVTLTATGTAGTYTVDVTVKAENLAVLLGNESYATLEEATAIAKSGDVITLNDNVTAANVVIPRGVTLNLADYALTADSVDGLKGSKITANINSGKLILGEGNKDNLGMPEDGYVLNGGNPVLPVWTGNSYVFDMFATTFSANDGSRGVFLADNTLRVQFATVCSSDVIYSKYLSSNASNAGLKVVLQLGWDLDTATANQELVFKNEHVAKAISNDKVGGQYWDFTVSVNGASSLGVDAVSDLTGVTAQVVLDCGIVYSVDF